MKLKHPYKIIEIESIDSTNNLAKKLLNNNEIKDNTVIFAYEQLNGKGQKNNKWSSQKNKNLILSLIVDISFISTKNIFYLINTISVACYKYLNFKLHDKNNFLSIKWVNDIYFEDKKIGGILIENIFKNNTLDKSIIGVGLNINQENFEENLVNKAIALKQISNLNYNLIDELNHLLSFIYSEFLILKTSPNTIFNNYNDFLYKKNKLQKFIYNGNLIEGIIIEANIDGQLVLFNNNKYSYFNYGSIEWIIN